MITLFTGAMGCGKSTHIINHFEEYGEQHLCMAFKPGLDSRTPNKISSRDGRSIDAIEVNSFADILLICKLKEIETIYVDEVQFIDIYGLRELFIYVKKNNISIIAGGLDLTSELQVFNVTGRFMCYANRIVKLAPRCSICNKEYATLSDCLVEKEQAVLVGGDDVYIKACHKCHSLIK